MNFFIIFLFAAFHFNPITSEYIAISHLKTATPNPCSIGGTGLVEKFFNFIFTEFQSNPPVCVCVQMCFDQPTYCYPNGCLKRQDIPKKDTIPQAPAAPPFREVVDQQPASFIVPGPNDRFESPQVINLSNEKSVVKTEKSLLDDMRPNPFNDRFISLFKYRKTPRVHLRYNLREQVKNTKSDRLKIEKVDTPSNKWATSVNYKPLTVTDKKPLLNDDPFEDASFKLPPIANPVIENKISAQSRYFKRELAKLTEYQKSNDIQNTTENSAMLLDNIIENLIENNFQPLLNETDLDFDIDLIYPVDNITNEVTISRKRYLPIIDDYSRMLLNETTDVISLNLTNENKAQNVYKESGIVDTFKNVYNEMIENMSKRIDTKNNSSAEYLKIIGKQLEDVTESTIADMKEITTRTTQVKRTAPTTVLITELTTTKRTTVSDQSLDTTITSIVTTPQQMEEKELPSLKKSRQKLTRKMQNSKLH